MAQQEQRSPCHVLQLGGWTMGICLCITTGMSLNTVNCTTCTATLALQLELKVVVVVGAKLVIAADPIIEHANTPNVYKGTGCN